MTLVRCLTLSALALLLSTQSLGLWAAQAAATAPGPDINTHVKLRKAKPPAAPPLNGLAQAAANGGVVECIGRIQQVTDFLTGQSKSGAFLFLAPADANRHLASASLEIQAGSVSTYASANFAPDGAGGCGGMYETVAYWANRCEEVATRVFASYPSAGKLSASISMLDGGPTMRVFLMPAGQGCLSIKKEMIY